MTAVDKKHEKEPYYLESGYKSYYFYEDDALDTNGKLKTDKVQAVNKVCNELSKRIRMIYLNLLFHIQFFT